MVLGIIMVFLSLVKLVLAACVVSLCVSRDTGKRQVRSAFSNVFH
jgi:Na+-transporting methylmalonyl-CoA/oxaloacetate decarboxylase gamma subunit